MSSVRVAPAAPSCSVSCLLPPEGALLRSSMSRSHPSRLLEKTSDRERPSSPRCPSAWAGHTCDPTERTFLVQVRKMSPIAHPSVRSPTITTGRLHQRGLTMGKSRAGMARLGTALSLGVLVIALGSGTGASAAPSASTPGSSVPTGGGGVKGQPGYLVYWDQNEEVDFLSMPKDTLGQLLPAWDLNGQMCVLPGGRFVGGYDPTLPSQHNLGGLKPYKQPADGEELDEPNGSFSGQTLYVPGQYKMRGQSIGTTLHRVPTASSTTTRPTPGASSTVVTMSSPTTLPRPRVITRRRAAGAWSNGSPRITLRTASCTAPMRGAWVRTTQTAPGVWPSPAPWHWRPTATCWCRMSALPACCASRRAPFRPVPPNVPAASTA